MESKKLLTGQNQVLPKKPNVLFIVTDQDRGLIHFPAGWEINNLVA